MKIEQYWSDEDTIMAARFDDGWTIAATEKAAVTIDTEGTITGTWWKEEPTDEHWKHFMAECNAESTEHPRLIDEKMCDIIGKAGHYFGEAAAEAARELKALIDSAI